MNHCQSNCINVQKPPMYNPYGVYSPSAKYATLKLRKARNIHTCTPIMRSRGKITQEDKYLKHHVRFACWLLFMLALNLLSFSLQVLLVLSSIDIHPRAFMMGRLHAL
mmetsp:Transcript_30979/g.81350  ORF Transcript_30979/g.81350 Transcript_30979/m.81350 type:complete len:108 (-) Transcript_30979:484-807(-)